MPVFIEPYNPNWKIEFEKIKQVINNELNGLKIDIQHIGSTAIPDMFAKPILDIDIVIDNNGLFNDIKLRLENIGYRPKGEQGITGRFVFKQTCDQTPFTSPKHRWQPHHLYVCYSDSLALKNHLSFRNALLKDNDLVKNYVQLKKSLIENFEISKEKYQVLKTDFIISVLATAGFDKPELDEIINANT